MNDFKKILHIKLQNYKKKRKREEKRKRNTEACPITCGPGEEWGYLMWVWVNWVMMRV